MFRKRCRFKSIQNRFGTNCTLEETGRQYTIKTSKEQEKLIQIPSVRILTTEIQITVSQVFGSKFRNISEQQSSLLPQHRFTLDPVTHHISCSAGRCGNVFGACQESRSIYLGSPCINPSPSWTSVSPLVRRKKKKESFAPPLSEWKTLPLNLATGFQAQYSFFGAFVTKQMWCLWKKD